MQFNFNSSVEGRFRITKTNSASGELTHDTGWFDNVITNYGMDAIGNTRNNAIIGAAVGRGTTPESVNDTLLVQPVANSFTVQAGSQGPSQGSTVSPYYARIYTVYRFAAGSVVGNISEVGAIHEAPEPNRLFSRTLIKDSNGQPVTITVLADEILDVAYECRVYPQLTPTEGSATLLGNVHAFKITPINIASARMADILIGGLQVDGQTDTGIYNGPLGPAPQYQSGGFMELVPIALAKNYESGDFYLKYNVSVAPGVLTNRELSVINAYPRSRTSTIGFAIEITPPFVKPSTVELRCELTVSWSRRA